MSFTKKLIWQKFKNRYRLRKEITRNFTVSHSVEFKHLDTFHRATRPCISLAHIFGVMPLMHTFDYNPYRVKFKVPCWAMTTTVLFFLFGGLKTLLFSVQMFKTGINAKNIVGIVYFYMTFIICINFLNLARNWPQLIQHWTRIDLMFHLPPYKPPNWSIRKQLRALLISFWITALVENCLYYSSGYYNFRMRRLNCHPEDKRYSFKDYVQMDLFKDVFAYFPYNTFLAVYAFFFAKLFRQII